METSQPTPETVSTLDPHQRHAVLALIARAETADGVAPVNEQARLEIGRTDSYPGTAHQLCRTGDDLVGYGFLDSTTGDPVAQLVVDPRHRRRGIGTAMLGALGFDPRDPERGRRLQQQIALRMWSFGDLPEARGFADALGYRPVRELLVMARDMTQPIPDLPLPEGVTIRTFEPRDLSAVVRVNAHAFAHHPEQGGLTDQDFGERMAETWFDPAGLLVATRTPDPSGATPAPATSHTPTDLIGFHWTKRHDEETGEVYVIGVDPDASGGGVGRALLHAGLRHLADQRARRVILYVEGDQRFVVALYESTGFDVVNRDVVYASPGALDGHSPAG